MLFGKTDYSFERELSFVEWCNLFTFCNILYAYGRFGCPTFSLGRFRERLCQNGLGRKGEDGLRKISNIPWNGYCGGSNFQKQLERIRTILFRGDSNRLIDEQSHTQKNFKEDMYMYNNFSSKKTKKVISALLASALVVTSGPITAAAATNKVVGVKKSFTVTASATNKVTGLSKAEKKVVKVTKKGKKFTIKGLKAGKATFKIGKKAYTVKVGATAVKAAKAKVTLTAGKSAAVKFTATAGNGDTVAFKTSNKKVATLSKTSAKVSKNAAYVRVTAKAAGTAKVTATSKVTGKKAVVTVTVKAAATPATATPDVTATPVVTGGATTTPDVTATPVVTGGATTTPEVTTTPVVTGGATTTPDVTATPVTTPAVTATPEVTSASAVSAAAINVRTIAVTFNRDLTKSEQAAVKVEVTREKATQSIKATFKDAKTLYITRDSETAFAAATYKVGLTGEVKATFDVAVQAQKATALTIDSTVLVDGNDKAEIKVSLVDQYGEKMNYTADAFSIIATNKTQNNKAVTVNVADNKFTVDTKTTAEEFKTNDEIQLTLLHKSSALSATATLKVVESTYVTSIELASNVTLPTGVTRLTQNSANASAPVKVYYTAKNNYGEAVDLKDATDAYTLTSTNPSVLDTSNVEFGTDADGKTYVAIKGFGAEGNATLVLLTNRTGALSKIDLNVLKNAGEVNTAEYAATSVEVAQGSKAYIPMKFYDMYGDKVEASKATVALTPSDSKLAANFISTPGDNYGSIEIDATSATANSTVIVTATVNGVPTIITVKVGATAVPSNLTVKADTTSLIAGSTAKIALDVKDQYAGSATVADTRGAEGSYYVKATVLDNTDEVVTAAVTSSKEVTVTGVKAGTRNVKVDLVKVGAGEAATDTVVDTKTVAFTVEANTATNLTYAVNDIATLYKGAAFDGAKENAYAKEITITGKKANGAIINIPASKILSVTSDNANVKAGKVSDKWYVGANAADADKITADLTAKLTIVVATDDGSTIVTKDVTVSKEDKKAVALKLYDKANTETDKKEISAITLDNYTDDATLNLYTVDQFGVEEAVTAADAVSLSSFSTGVAKASDDTAKIAGGKLTITDTNSDTVVPAKATFKATIVKGALTKTVTVTVTTAK
jgi:hypothetical protein